jgi:nucleoside-triphosphatase THEP1
MADLTISTLPTTSLIDSLLSRESVLTFLTGPRGAGKTTLCRDLVAQIYETGSLVGGFICPAVFEDGKKIGIDMLNLASGERRRLGRRAQNGEEATVGCWQLDEGVLAWGNQILAGLIHESVIVIDELGPLELEEGYGYQEALHLLDEKRYRSALVVVRPEMLKLAQLRWPYGRVLDLESENTCSI